MKKLILLIFFVLLITNVIGIVENETFIINYGLQINMDTGAITLILEGQEYNYPMMPFNYTGSQSVTKAVDKSIIQYNTIDETDITCTPPVEVNLSELDIDWEIPNSTLTCNPAPCINTCPSVNTTDIAKKINVSGLKINSECPSVECNNEGLLKAINEVKNKDFTCDCETVTTTNTDNEGSDITLYLIIGFIVLIIIIILIFLAKKKPFKRIKQKPKEEPKPNKPKKIHIE